MAPRKPRARPSHERGEFYNALGHTIKVARTDLGIDRKALAEQAGISYSYLAAIENGQKQPSSQVLVVIAEALGLRTHELLESVEGRRDRNLAASEEYPGWLKGGVARRMPGRALGAPMAPMPAASVQAPQSAAPLDDSLDPFIAELERFARTLSDSDKQLLLEMARKLAE